MKNKLLSFAAAGLLLASCSKNQNTVDNFAGKTDTAGQSFATASTVAIDASTLQQNIRGFGGASILAWIGDLTSAQRIKAFDPNNGMGLSILRVRIPNSTADFAVEKPTIDAAKSYGASVIATAWSAPASMKDNGANSRPRFWRAPRVAARKRCGVAPHGGEG